MAVRMAAREDIPAILDIYRPYVETTCISFEYETPTLAEFTQRFESYTQQFPWLVWEENGQILGYAYGSRPWSRAAYQWCAEGSVYVAEQAHRRGIGKALYRALEALLFAQGYRVIYCLVTTDNPASIAFHEALGYRVTATLPACGYKMGKELGVVYLEKRREFVDFPIKSPIPASAIVNNDRNLDQLLAKITLS